MARAISPVGAKANFHETFNRASHGGPTRGSEVVLSLSSTTFTLQSPGEIPPGIPGLAVAALKAWPIQPSIILREAPRELSSSKTARKRQHDLTTAQI